MCTSVVVMPFSMVVVMPDAEQLLRYFKAQSFLNENATCWFLVQACLITHFEFTPGSMAILLCLNYFKSISLNLLRIHISPSLNN